MMSKFFRPQIRPLLTRLKESKGFIQMLTGARQVGKTTTLAHYLHLLEGVGMLAGLQKYAGSKVKQRSSSPKLQVLNNALMTAGSNHTLSSAQLDKEFWGRLTESAIGACLLNGAISGNYKVFYWRDSQREVDFVVRKGKHLTAIEVKSGCSSGALAGMKAFSSAFHPTKKLIIGEEGLPIEKFLSKPPEYWLF